MAADLRRRAAQACEALQPAVCMALLDEAAKRDPAGDATPDVAQLRRKAQRTLEAKPR